MTSSSSSPPSLSPSSSPSSSLTSIQRTTEKRGNMHDLGNKKKMTNKSTAATLSSSSTVDDELDAIFSSVSGGMKKNKSISSSAEGEKHPEEQEGERKGKGEKRKHIQTHKEARQPTALPSPPAPPSSSSSPPSFIPSSDSDEDDSSLPHEERSDPNAPNNIQTIKRIKQKLAAAGSDSHRVPSSSSSCPSSLSSPPDDMGFTRASVSGVSSGRTKEGYRIYKIENLNMGKGKDTPLCPIDCDCCF